MSSYSPRASVSETMPSEVVQDFDDSLKDLSANNKYEIQNLTLIAKESTEHAQAISQVLERHIKATQPQRKLPALYVLDSIIKNVGTPYTVYLGRNLYSTFMEAYALVDGPTRRAMEAMLKTWKEPVLGSMDSRPVFAPELVRPIENALNKVRTVTQQHPRQMMQHGYPNRPTPPQFNGYPPPQQHMYNGPGQQQYQAMPQAFHMPAQHQNDLEALKRELTSLIRSVEQELSRDAYNNALQTKLQALLDLNTVLYTNQLGSAEFGMIASQIHAMSAASRPMPQPTPPVMSTQQWQPPPPYAQFQAPPVAIPPPQLNDLAALINNVPKPSTPQVRAAVPSLQNAPHAQVNAIQTQATTVPAMSSNDLLAALTKAGLMKGPQQQAAAAAPLPPPPPQPPVHTDLAALLGSLSKAAPANPAPARLDFSNKASLEIFRPELLQALYSDRPSQCPQCGRRFANTADGQRQKNLHLDWHFRINQRIAESARGQHRQWYISEMEWMKLEEFDESTVTADTTNPAQAAAAAKAAKDKPQPYIRAPAGVTRVTCSICYEEMRSSYMEEVQDWVFQNAAMNNGKIVHATCLAEMQQGVQPAQATTTAQQISLAAALAALQGNRETSKTPDSSLGKRKAEDQAGGVEKVLRGS